ncbi:2OG-Fe dioxygenase family protein [Kushneria aurantia]|uniref:2OG-Fe dioxygenase family protein n=1 Tax=Kushneria aurantia TaxID=504092 RepID=A0ABV6G3N0_9GAMM|nr:2OG-Fe dioxygenase family protein [Kushneria aurantia]
MPMQTVAQNHLRKDGCAFFEGSALPIPDELAPHAEKFVAEWDSMEVDKYLKDGATFRERRYGRYAFQPSTERIVLLKQKPYFQAAKTNAYAGGVQRVVAPVTDSITSNPVLSTLIKHDFKCFPASDYPEDDWWLVACHMFRIIGRKSELGEPTPEGVHRDDIDFGAIHLIKRQNTVGGLSRIHENDRSVKAEHCLEGLFDTLYWADRQVLHSVTPIAPANGDKPAIRDILVLGYTHTPKILKED